MSEPASSKLAGQPTTNLLADAMPVLVSYIDASQTYRFANAAFRPWFDVAPEELVGMPLKDFLGEKRYQQIEQHVKLALDGYQVETVVRALQRATGRQRSGLLKTRRRRNAAT